MKKLMCLALGVSMIGAMIVVAGCGGGGGIGAVLGAAFIIAIVASTGGAGGAGAVPFAASLRERPAIRAAAIDISDAKMQFRVTPYTNGIAGTPVFADVIPSPTDSTKAIGTISMDISGSEYLVELVQGSTPQTFLQAMVVSNSLENGDVVNASVDPASTAAVLVYQKWSQNLVAEKSYNSFLDNLTNNNRNDINTLGNTISGNIESAQSVSSIDLGDYSNSVQTLANNVASPFTLSSLTGFYVLDPTANDDYAAFYGAVQNSEGRIPYVSKFDTNQEGYFSVSSNGTGAISLYDPLGWISVVATFTSETSGTYSASQDHTVVESGTYTKVTNAAACQGTWTGSYSGKSISATVNQSGFITSLTIDNETWQNPGFMVAQDGKAVAYAKTNLQETDSMNEMHLYGTVSNGTFNGVIDFDGEGATTGPQDGNITLTKSSFAASAK